jgi:hypothetical protein
MTTFVLMTKLAPELAGSFKTREETGKITQTLGALKAESWTAIPYSRIVDLSKEL